MSLYAKLEENKLGLYTALLVLFLFVFIYEKKSFFPFSAREEVGRGDKVFIAPGFNPGIISRLTAVLLIVSILHVSNCSVTGSISGTSPNLTPGEATATMDSLYDGLPAGTFYYTGDHLGSSSLVTNANGDEVLRIAYDSYGAVDLAQSGRLENGTLTLATDQAEYGILAVRFTGQEYDDRHGCLSVGGRMDAQEPTPQLGIFTTADNLVPYDKGDLNLTLYPNRDLLNRKKSDGKTKQIIQTGNMDMHRYMYVRGNPVKYTDPRGHEPVTIFTLSAITFALSLFSGGQTSPSWHNYTGRDRKREDFRPQTVLDMISFVHDEFKVQPFQNTNNPFSEIIGDSLFIGLFALSFGTGLVAFGNLAFGIEAVWTDLSKNCNGNIFCTTGAMLGSLIFGTLLGGFFALTDIGFGIGGSLLFAANITYNISRVAYNVGKVAGKNIIDVFNGNLIKDWINTVRPMSMNTFRNLDKPSEWRVPEGAGRFKNWNRPSEWCLNPFGC